MIKVENICVSGFEAAIRGMRNPMNSWDRSDSLVTQHVYKVGGDDLTLMKKLFQGGPEHRKYLRMIHGSMDVIAPLYWWKEFDTYKVGTVANSCSTMHTIAKKKFEVDDFSTEYLFSLGTIRMIIDDLNYNRELYLKTKNKQYWWQMIQLLPSSYNQRRTVDMSYETVFNIIHQRSGHKLDEWNEFVKILQSLPGVEEIGLKKEYEVKEEYTDGFLAPA